jgi:hypothetical protein
LVKSIVILIVLTVGLTLLLKFVVAPWYGPDVGHRFLERLNYIPSQQPQLLTEAALAQWLERENSDWVRGYACPVLFPLDVAFLACLGLALGFCSVALAGRQDFLAQVPVWIWWMLPALYMLADLLEDGAIAAVLTSAVPLNRSSFAVLRALTSAKLATVTIAFGQVGFLLALAGVLKIFPAKV